MRPGAYFCSACRRRRAVEPSFSASPGSFLAAAAQVLERPAAAGRTGSQGQRRRSQAARELAKDPMDRPPRAPASSSWRAPYKIKGTEDEGQTSHWRSLNDNQRECEEEPVDLEAELCEEDENSEDEEKMQAKESCKLLEFGVFDVVPDEQAWGRNHVTSRWEIASRVDAVQARFVAWEFRRCEVVDHTSAPSSPSRGRLVDNDALNLKHRVF